MIALAQQIGGTHYKQLPYQPVELFAKTRCTPFQANIWKYISRYPYKNKGEDIKKALHYAELAQVLNCPGKLSKPKIKEAIKYCNLNALGPAQRAIILAAAWDNYDEVIKECKNLIRNEYPKES